MDITQAVIDAFRAYYPEFSDTTDWPSSALTRHLEAADDETGSSRWGAYIKSPASLKARGLYAYAAHLAVLRKAVQTSVQNGQTPTAPHQVESKTVGDESVSFAVHRPDTGARADTVGDLQTTFYGQEFLRLRRRAGTGAVTTGVANL